MAIDSSNLSIPRKILIILYGLLAAAAVVLLVPLCALVVGIAFTFANQTMHWFDLGETESWLGIIFALYALYAGIVIGPVVWWRFCAKRLALSQRQNKIGTTAVAAIFAIVCLWVLHGEQAITNNISLEAVADDGRFVLAQSSPSGSSALYKIETSTGAASRLTSMPSGYEGDATISPDGLQVAFTYSNDERNHTIMLTDLSGKNTKPLLREGGNDSWPQFSRDGKTIYFMRTTGVASGAGFDLFSTSLDGKIVTRLTHQHFSFNGGPYLQAAPAVSSDGSQLLLTSNDSLRLYSLASLNQQPTSVAFRLPNSPPSPLYVSAYFSPDDRNIVFMAAAEGKDGYEYDAYRGDPTSRDVQRITNNNGYASDFRVSTGGKKAVFLKWKLSRFQKLPRGFQLQLMDMQSGTVIPLRFAGLPQ